MVNYSVAIKSILTEPSPYEWELLYLDLPKALIDKANQYKSWKQKAIRLIGWQLLLTELKKENCKELINYIGFAKKGKPFFEKGSLYFNLSNTKNTVILVVSDSEIGVDLEFSRPCKKTIYTRVFCEEEISYLENSKDESFEFINLWTKKEAVVKLFGGGISMGLNKFSVLNNELSVFDRTVLIEKYEVEGGIAHIACYKA